MALDHHDMLAEIGGAERGGVAAGAGAEHQRGRTQSRDLSFAGAGAGFAAAGCSTCGLLASAFAGAAVAASPSAKVASRSPWLTLSPTFTLICPDHAGLPGDGDVERRLVAFERQH